MKFNKLTPEEEKIIIYKNTEHPFTGKYNDYFKQGVYVCKRCDNPLFTSDAKFKSGCGWPSFDHEIKGMVIRILDKSRLNTEIICARCKGHLGHVFEGEGYTKKNLRSAVNSLSIKFIPNED